MTQIPHQPPTSWAPAQAVARRPLAPTGPSQSQWLVHFAGRPPGRKFTPQVPTAIQALSAQQRLDSMLAQGLIAGFPPFGASQPAVCLSESPLDHLGFLLQRGWAPWGVILNRQWVWDRGGGMVHYRRPEQYPIRPDDEVWAVRHSDGPGGFSDWTYEREWRIPLPAEHPWLPISPADVVALLVGDPTWWPSSTSFTTAAGEPIVSSADARWWTAWVHGPWNRTPRWLWTGSGFTQLTTTPVSSPGPRPTWPLPDSASQ